MAWKLKAALNTAVHVFRIVRFWLWWIENYRNFGHQFLN